MTIPNHILYFCKATFLVSAIFLAFSANISAQQLYISDINVGDGGFNNCTSGTLGTDRSFFTGLTGNAWADSALIEYERPHATYPGACLSLCATITCITTEEFGIDELTFEIFKFGSGSNPLDPASTPPVRTISRYNLGNCNSPTPQVVGTFCSSWDGSYNLNGAFGKTTGQFGFRARVRTNQVSATAGNISIEQTSAYPGQNQIPIQVNVTNIHVARSSPTVVGITTGVGAQPYHLYYRLSKDATASIKIYDANASEPPLRTIISGAPRIGEGSPDGTLTNEDLWDGRNSSGDILPAGVYQAQITASSNDMWGSDLANTTTIQIAVDPLRITDLVVTPASPAAMGKINYMLTEAATVYLDIYSPGTTFSSINTAPPVLASGTLKRRIIEQKGPRTTVSTYWDGRDDAGQPVSDGDYVYALYAGLSSPAGVAGKIYTTVTKVGTFPSVAPVASNCGLPVNSLTQASTVTGSSPSVAGLDPFHFYYTPSRDVSVSLNIKDLNGALVRQVFSSALKGADLYNEVWDGKNDGGAYVASGTYQAELIVNDIQQCSSLVISTLTALVPVNLFRIVDVETTPLLSATTDVASISYQLSQPMQVELNIYSTSTAINPAIWPPTGLGTPIHNVQGIRTGRSKHTESWDGRNPSGYLMPDGRYPFTLVATSTSPAQIASATDKTYGYVDIARGQITFSAFDVTPSSATMYNSGDTVNLPPYKIDYMVSRQSSITVQILTLGGAPQIVSTLVNGQIKDGSTVYQVLWNGKDDQGNFVRGGTYNVRVTAQDVMALAPVISTVQVTSDAYPLRIYDASITPLNVIAPGQISYQISEPMKVVTKFYKPGTSFDSNGNPSPSEATSLIKLIIGMRQGRTLISESWDGLGTDSKLVPSGSYPFRIYASTDANAINDADGSVVPGGVLAEDVISANLPITNLSAPSGITLSAVYITSAAITIGQTGNPTGTSVSIERSTDNVSFLPVVTGTSTAYIQSGLTSYTTYYFRARNKNFADIYTEYGNTLQLFTKDAIPAPPGNLAAVSIEGNKILLTWEPSPFEWVTEYRIYFDSGTGTIDYASPIATLSASATSYTTNVLISSAAYRFGLRAVNRSGVEDWNVSSVTSDAFTTHLAGARTAIKVPQSGKHIKGNQVTVVAETIAGKVGQVLFQYRPANSSTWLNIPSANVNSANPDTEAPYFIHWDVDALGIASATPYELRTVASDVFGTGDAAPPAITVVIDPIDYDINESVVSGEIQKEQKINNAVTNTVQAADQGGDLVTKVVIPPGALAASTVAVSLISNPVAKPPPPEGAEDLNISLKVNLANSQSQLSSGKTATLSFSYKDDNDDGIVDGTLVSVDQLKMYSASTLGTPWTLIPSSVDKARKIVTGETSHFSFFAVFAGAAANLTAMRAYPVPFIPNDNNSDNGVKYTSSDPNSGIIFDNLPAAVKVKIFTISGQLVADFETTNSLGKLQWDVKNNDGKDVASGGYIAVISSPGSKTVTKKLLVIR